jgi:4-alpha-glucanotransferase
MYLFHDSRQLEYRRPFGAVPVGSSVTLGLDVTDCCPSQVYLRLWLGHEVLVPMEPSSEKHYEATITLPEEPGLLWYYFVVETEEGAVCFGHPLGSKQGLGEVTDQPESWQITVYEPTELPGWYEGSLVYQIFPDRFARGEDWQKCQENAAHPQGWKGTKRLVVQDWDDTPFYCKDAQGRVTRWPFFGGTLQGIQEKLPYLKSLGVGVLYLNPIFLASSNHKYDTADYLTIDPGFGTEEDFSLLCAEAEKLGIRIILDGVFNHTGDDSIYFNRYGNFPEPGACSEAASPYDSWYRFGTEYPAGYDCWWGVDALPNVEESDPGFEALICGETGVIRKWLRLGASGWRLDVADELPDSFIGKLRQAVKAQKADGLLLGEVWEDASNKISYGKLRDYLLGRELDATMHYPFRVSALDFFLGNSSAQEFANTMDTLRENYPPSALAGALNLVGTHDTPRILTLLGEAPQGLSEAEQETYRLPDPQLALRRLKLLDVLLFTFPGVPCVYYGDEAGMEGYADPFNRGPFPWGKENGDLQYHVRMLSHLRKEYPVLSKGSTRYLAPASEVFGLERKLENASALIYVNRSQETQTVSLPDATGTRLDLLTGNVLSGTSLTLPPLSGAILYREGTQEDFSPLPSLAKTPTGKGVLCPLFSLPGGTMGKSAYEFLDTLHRAGYQNWMLLPLCPAGEGDSPYSSRGIFAGDPRFIDSDIPVPMSGYEAFCRENSFWLEDYALYTVLKRVHGDIPWQQWPWRERDRKNLPTLRRRYAGELQEIMEEQYRFDYQWHKLKAHAEELGISLVGDLPIYAALDGADTWANRDLFQLDEKGYPRLRAGCPPDYFSPEGQDWGNPLYDWDKMSKDDYLWWRNRLKFALKRFTYVRLDHFRGFAAYYAIPAGNSAKEGYWMKGPGRAFFQALARELGSLPILAEDLGTLDSQVTVLLRETGLSGMNVWQFTPDLMEHMSPEEAQHRVFFSGTHDNQTLKGFLRSTGDHRSPQEILEKLSALPAAAVIFPVQDLLDLGDEARINVPGVPTGNWHWQMTPEMLDKLA